MGNEADCRVRFGPRASEGHARLEGKELIFRGGFRLKIPFRDVKSIEVARGVMKVVFPGGEASFDLGPAAEKWAGRIRNPKGLLDKLGVKPGMKVSLLGIDDEGFREQIAARTDDVSDGRAAKGSDIVFVKMTDAREAARLKSLRAAIKPDGAVWVVWPKGQKAFREDDARNAGPAAGLVDVKVASFSDTLSALKMVIPVKARPVLR
jgi:Protein of unknown function (DUF3052)